MTEQSCRQSCHGSWQTLRQSPIFGCICPNNMSNKKSCDKIFEAVNGNDCIGELGALVGIIIALLHYNSQSNYHHHHHFCLVIFFDIGHQQSREVFAPQTPEF